MNHFEFISTKSIISFKLNFNIHLSYMAKPGFEYLFRNLEYIFNNPRYIFNMHEYNKFSSFNTCILG